MTMEIKNTNPGEYRDVIERAQLRAHEAINQTARELLEEIERRSALVDVELPSIADADFAFVADANIHRDRGDQPRMTEVTLSLGHNLYVNGSSPGYLQLDRRHTNGGREITPGKYRVVLVMRRIGEVDANPSG